MLIVNGYTSGYPSVDGRNAEIIDLENSSFVCPNLNKFPANCGEGIGGLIGEIPFVCGGWSWDNGGDWFVTNACYTLKDNGEWIEDHSATLNTERGNAGSVSWKNSLVIAGGYAGYSYGGPTSTIEMASPNTKSTMLPIELPHALSGACMVLWDSNTLMLIGGGRGDETYFINMNNNTISNGPKLNTGRSYHACEETIVNDTSYIVVTGGYGVRGRNTRYSTELISKSSITNHWENGKNMMMLLTH